MTIEELEQIAKSVHLENAKYDFEVNVCMDLACMSQGADKLKDALVKAVEASGKKVLVRKTGCMGPCSSGPLVRVDPEENLYKHVNSSHAEAIVTSLGGDPVAGLQCDLSDHFESQARVGPETAGYIDPEKIDDYISRDGYKALLTALTEMTPNGVIHRITESGLRGRGGGGYPTGLKWGTVAKAAGCHPVSTRPQMLTPIALPQRLILRQKPMGTLSLEVLHRARHRQMRRDREQQVYMVTVYRPGVDRHLMATADFSQQLPCAQPNIPNQNRVSIFGHPYDMIFAIPYRVTARFRRLHNRRMLLHPVA